MNKTNIKVFKSVFRLDYNISYLIIDKLGEILELIHKISKEVPFKIQKSNINTSTHAISHKATIDGHPFDLGLDIKTFYFAIEFIDGYDINQVSKCKIFELANAIIKKIEIGNSSYERIGYRSYILFESQALQFDEIMNFMWKNNNVFGKSVSQEFGHKKDIACVLESGNEIGENTRISLGPYQKDERQRYFDLENNIEEGFIIDIDIYEKKIDLPGFDIVQKVSHYQKKQNKFVDNISKSLSQELSNGN